MRYAAIWLALSALVSTGCSEDLHLGPASGAIDRGSDLSSTFADDIDRDARAGAWDIGADERVP